MTSFVDDNGNYLEYKGADIPVTKSAASVYDFKIKGDVSLNFKLSNNSHNRKSLGYKGPMDIGRVAFSKLPFTMLRNGNFFLRGFLVIQGDDGVDLDCFFISGNANWFNSLNKNVSEIEMNSLTALTKDLTARIGNTSGIIFPLLDLYNGEKNTNYWMYLTLEGEQFGPYYSEFVPCVYLHSLVTVIANDAEIQITGNVIDSGLFKQIILTPYTLDMAWPPKFVNESNVEVTRTTDQTMAGVAYDQIEFDVINFGDGSRYNTSTWEYIAPVTGVYRIDINMIMDTSQTYAYRAYVGGAFDVNLQNIQGSLGTDASTRGFVKLIKGEALTIWVSATGGVSWDINSGGTIEIKLNEKIYEEDNIFRSLFQQGVYVPVNAIIKGIKGVDLIKAIAAMFGAQCTFNEFTQTISIDRIDSINTYEDWSSYYRSHDINYNTFVAKNNYLDYASVSDDFIDIYNTQNEKKFGSGNIAVDTDLKENATVVNLPFGPCHDTITPRLWQAPYVPFLKFTEDTVFDFTSIGNAGGLAQFTGTGYEGFFAGQVIYINSNTAGQYNGYHIVKSTSSTVVTVFKAAYLAVFATLTGTISILSISKISTVNRALLCLPSYSVSNIARSKTNYDINVNGAESTNTTLPAVWFYKKPGKVTFDEVRTSLAFDDLAGVSYSNVTLGKLNFSRLKNMMKNPIVRVEFLLPESVLQSFNFDKIIHLNTKDLQGDFYVLKVGNYMNAKESVSVDLIRI